MAKEPKKKDINELSAGSTEWQNAFYALSPQDQASIFGQATTPAVDYDFGTAAADPLGWGQIAGRDPLGLGQISSPAGAGAGPVAPGFQGFSLDPMYQQLLQSGGGVNIPTLTAKGELEPWDLPQEAARTNLMQDQATSMADLVLAAMSGPGAIDPQAFAPVVTKPTERIATPGLDRVKQYSQGTGAKAYIARKIMAGATDDEAIADLFNFIDTPDSPEISDADRKTKQMIIDSMPSAFKTGQIIPPSGRGTGGTTRTSQDTRDLFNESSLATDAREMYEKAYEDQSKIDVGYEDPEHPGTYFTEAPVEEDSPAMQKFRNLGLPSPFAAYDDPEYLKMAMDTVAPNLGGDLAQREEDIGRTQAEQARVGRETRGVEDRNLATQRLFKENFQPAGFVPPPGAGPLPTPRAAFASGNTPQSMTRLPLHKPPAPFSLAPANYQPDRMNPNAPSGIVNPAGGFDFGTRPAGQQAMFNRLLNAAGGLDIVGGTNRGTQVAPLNQETANKSAAQADEARKRYALANSQSYNAMQRTTPEMAMAAQMLGRLNNQAAMGNTPFTDVLKQRKLGQRAQGVRA